MRATSFLVPVLMALGVSSPAHAQANAPTDTFVESVLRHPGAYHLRQVRVYGTLRTETNPWWLESDEGPRIRVCGDTEAGKPGRVELLADVIDVGRLPASDPRLTNTPLQALLIRAGLDRWPRPGEFVVLSARQTATLKPATGPSLRAVVLEAARFDAKTVTIVGQFRGRNLYADLPAEPGVSPHDFVLRDGTAAVWVVGLLPRVNGVNLDLKSRTGASEWFAVEGVVRRGNGLVWLAGVRMAAAPTPAERLPQVPIAVLQDAPEVWFSVPAADETDVSRRTTVRIQYSRPIDPATLTGRIRVSYAGLTPGSGDDPAPPFAVDYAISDRIVTLRFAAPLQRFRTITLDLLDGIATPHGTRAAPWRLQFTTGAQAPHE